MKKKIILVVILLILSGCAPKTVEQQCKDFSGYEDMFDCYVGYALQHNNGSVCHLINESHDKGKCLSYFNACVNDSSLDYCYYYIGIHSDSIERCKLVTNPSMRGECIGMLAVRQQNMALCEGDSICEGYYASSFVEEEGVIGRQRVVKG